MVNQRFRRLDVTHRPRLFVDRRKRHKLAIFQVLEIVTRELGVEVSANHPIAALLVFLGHELDAVREQARCKSSALASLIHCLQMHRHDIKLEATRHLEVEQAGIPIEDLAFDRLETEIIGATQLPQPFDLRRPLFAPALHGLGFPDHRRGLLAVQSIGL